MRVLLIGVLFTAILPIYANSQLIEANRGQYSLHVLYSARNGDISTAITESGFIFRGRQGQLSVKLEGAKIRCRPSSPVQSESNYLALSPAVRHVPEYSSIVCPGVYPGVDWVIHENGRNVEHDWKVAAGANPRIIRLLLNRAVSARLTTGGDLQLGSGDLSILWKAPESYQIIGGRRHPVASQYALHGPQVSVELGPYRHDLPLVIDPVIDFSYFVNGSGDDRGLQVGLDGAGNIYLAGLTTTPDFQTTPGAAFGGASAGYEIFVRKLSPDGSKLIYSTYLGAADITAQHPIGMRVDSAGNVYLATDFSQSPFGITAKIDPSGSVGIYKLAPAGDHLIYGAQVLPGFSYRTPVALAIDPAGNAYVGIGGYQLGVSKIDPTGTKQLYHYSAVVNTYPGGLAELAVAGDGTLYIAGTTSGDLTTTPGALKATIPDAYEGYLIRLKADGSGPIFSTYIGGDYDDFVSALAVDSSGNAYVGGQTRGTDKFPALQGTALGGVAVGSINGFVMEVDPQGDAAVFTALLPALSVDALALDPSGNVYAGGRAMNAVVMSKIDKTGSQLLYYSNIPASIPVSATGDFPFGLAVDSAGAAYVAGSMTDVQIPAPFTPYNAAAPNAFLLKIDPNPSQCDLRIDQLPSQSYSPWQTVTLTFPIHNSGPAEADDVVFTASVKDGEATNCRVTGSGVCTATNGQNIRVNFASIPPGGSETVELDIGDFILPPGDITATATISALTSDSNPVNNTATATSVAQYVTVTVSSFITGLGGLGNGRATYAITGATQPILNRNGSIFAPSYAPPNGQVQIFWPSPQAGPLGPIVFQKWIDGSTDNPRTFTATLPSISENAVFGLLSTPAMPTPYFTAAGVVNAGSYSANGVSPGEFVAIGGFNLGQQGSATVQDGRITTTLGTTAVTFDGTPAPLVYTSASQVNAIVPYEVADKSSTTVQVQYGTNTYSATVPVVQAVPALFTSNASGTGQAAALNQDLSLNSPSNPANPGDVIVLYGTGEGLVSPLPSDGAIISAPEPAPQLPISVMIGGLPAEVKYAAAAPGLAAGVIQINAVIPTGITPSHHVPVTWTAGNYTSQPGVTIAVKDSGSPGFEFQPGPDDLALFPISLSPARIAADSNATTVTVFGTGFSNGMVVRWNGQPRPTQFVDASTLQVSLTGVDLESPELGAIAVWDSTGTTQLSQTAPLLVYLPVANRDLVYDSMRDKIYVAVAASQVPQGSSIAAVNPETGRVERWYSLSVEPTKLAISGDDHYLYVALKNLVRRINLDSWTADLDIPLGSDPILGPREVFSMLTLPGVNNSLVVAFTETGLSPPYLGVGVFDDAQVRGKATGAAVSALLGGPDASTMYASGDGNLYTLQIDTSGIRIANTAYGLIAENSESVYTNGLIYSGSGAVIDPSIPRVVTTFDNQGLIVPAPQGKQVLLLGGVPPPYSGTTYLPPVLSLNDVSTGARSWSLPLPLQFDAYTGSMVLWGTNGVALREEQADGLPAPSVDLFRVNLSR